MWGFSGKYELFGFVLLVSYKVYNMGMISVFVVGNDGFGEDLYNLYV